MIQSIQIADVATFDSTPEVLGELSKFNFMYGANGSGKTTISKVIADECDFSRCSIQWRGGTKLQTLVYNRHFVESNFNQSTDLKGIFTLGKKNIEAIAAIDAAKMELSELSNDISDLKLALAGDDGKGGKRSELALLEEAFKLKCWEQKLKHDAKFHDAFKGVMGKKEDFKAQVLRELETNKAELDTLVNLEKKAVTVFGATPTEEASIPVVDGKALLFYEVDSILTKRVIGKTDVDIAAMIAKLSNSDWVKEGRKFYERNAGRCPFCQQETSERFTQSLNEYFDETFERDSKAISDLDTKYRAESSRIQKELSALLASPSRFLQVDKLHSAKAELDSCIATNAQLLHSKRKEPSHCIELCSHVQALAAVAAAVNVANSQIFEHNKTVSNLAQERRVLTSKVWKYLLDVELKTDIEDYKRKRSGLVKAIEGISAKIVAAIDKKESKLDEVRGLERETTSVQPAIDGINELLRSFEFRGFLLDRGSTPLCYRLVRPDGKDAKETLSEGERSFITFLYFYFLVKGSDSESGTTSERVVVFDDPVSSLDSDILFIVTSLIRGLLDASHRGLGHIKQIFVLTHNVYFHKEVTFNPKQAWLGPDEVTFWTIRKSGLKSKVERHQSNPIKTSYELLWHQVQKPDRSNPMIQNTLRRILEYYFNILGRIDHYKVCDNFDGKEKLACRALFSWIHDGSHYVDDDLYVSADDFTVDTYLKVFRLVFEKLGHLEHYKMMMGDAYEEQEFSQPMH